MATSVGNLLIHLGLDSKALSGGVSLAQGMFGRLNTSIGSTIKILSTLGTAIAGGSLVYLVKQAGDVVDSQSKMAYRLNTSIESIQALTYAADLSGVSHEGLTRTVEVLNTRLGQAARDSYSPAAEQLRRLGISTRDLINQPVDQRLVTIAESFQRLRLTTSQQADALRQLGIRNAEMLNLMEAGGAQIKEAVKDVRAFGLAVTDVDGRTIERANDAWTTAGMLIKGIATQLAVQLAPLLRAVADYISDAGREAGGFGNVIGRVIETVIVGVGQAQRAVYDLRMEWINFRESVEGWTVVDMPSWLVAIIPPHLREAMRTTRTDFVALRRELGEAPNPEKWRSWWQERVAREREISLADEVERAMRRGSLDKDIDETTLKEREAATSRLDELRKSLANESELLTLARDEELKKLDEFNKMRVLKAGEYATLRQQIEEKFASDRNEFFQTNFAEQAMLEDELLETRHKKLMDKLQEFENAHTELSGEAGETRRRLQERHALAIIQLNARQWSTLAGIVDTSMGHMQAAIGDRGGAAFNVMKAISMATALVKGYEAVTSAIAAGWATGGGPAAAAAFGAIAAAGVAAQIAALAAVKPGDSAAPASPTVGTGATAAAAAGGTGPGQTLFVSGFRADEMLSGDAVRALAMKLVKFQEDGGKVVFEE